MTTYIHNTWASLRSEGIPYQKLVFCLYPKYGPYGNSEHQETIREAIDSEFERFDEEHHGRERRFILEVQDDTGEIVCELDSTIVITPDKEKQLKVTRELFEKLRNEAPETFSVTRS